MFESPTDHKAISQRLTIGLAALLIVAFLIRLAVVLTLGLTDIATYSENGQIAARLAAGQGYTFDFYGLRPENPLRTFVPPLYSGIVWFCLTQFSDPATALGVIHALLSVLAIVAIFYFTLALTTNQLLALAVATGVAFHPVYILSIVRPHTLLLNLLLVAGVLWASSKLQEKATYGWAITTGFTLGLAIYSRSMLVGLCPILVIGLWLNSTDKNAKITKLALAMTTTMLIVILPWTVYAYQSHHQFVFMATNGGFNFWIGNNPFTIGSGMEVYTDQVSEFLQQPPVSGQPAIQEMYVYPLPPLIQSQIKTLNELALDRQLYQAGWDFIWTQPRQAASLFLTKFLSFVWFRVNLGQRYDQAWVQPYKYLYGALLIPFLVGVLVSLRQWRRYVVPYLLFIYYILFYTLFHVQTRYRWEIEAYMLVFVALAVHWLGQRLRQSRTAST